MYNCLGASLVKDVRSQLTPHGAGQRKAAGPGQAIAAAKRIARGDAKEAFYSRAFGRSTMEKKHGRASGLNIFSEGSVNPFAAIARNMTVGGAPRGAPDLNTAARRLSRAGIGLGGSLGADLTDAALAASLNVRRGLYGPAMPRGLQPGGVPDTSARYRYWYDRMYGRPPVPGLGKFDFSSIFGAATSVASGGNVLDAVGTALQKRETDKAAKDSLKMAQAEAKAERARAKQAEFQMTAGQTRTRNILLYGGLGLLAVGVTALILKKRKK